MKVDSEGYEYKTIRTSPIRFNLHDAVGHQFGYVKRRRVNSESKFTAFKPYCSCKWKSTTWHGKKELAQREHEFHIKDYRATHPTLSEA